MLAYVTQSEGEKSMLNAATVFSFLLLPFDNAKLSREGRNMHKMQDEKKCRNMEKYLESIKGVE